MALTKLQPFNLSNTGSYVFGNANVTGNTLTANLTVSGVSNLGAVGNVIITGGSSGQVLSTNGSGNLSWISVSSTSISNGNSNVNIPAANGNINLSVAGNANVLVVTGTGVNVAGNMSVTGNLTAGNFTTAGSAGNISGANVITACTFIGNTANFSTALNVTGLSNLGPVGNVTITGGSSGQYLQTNGSGGLSWATISSISNGNSNVNIPAANGNVNISSAGNANIVVVTGTGVNIAGTSNVTGNIVGGSNLNISGNAVFGGNLTVDGSLVYVNVTDLAVEDPIIQLQTGPNAAPPTSNSGKDVGTALNYYDTAAKIAWMGWDVSNAEIAFGANVGISSEVVTFTSLANIRAGNAQLGNLVTANFYSGTLTTAAQPNITSLGILSSLTVTGNISAANFMGNLANGNSDIAIPAANGNINFDVAGNANVVVITGNGLVVNGTSNLGPVGNVTITGGSSGQYLQTNGVGGLSWATISTSSISNGNSNVNIPAANGNVNISSAGNANVVVITGNGLVVNGTSNLGPVGNVTITGGSNGQVLTTNGSGGLSWTTASGGGGGANIANGNSNVNIATANGNITMSVAGNANIMTVTGTGIVVTGNSNLGSNTNVKINGGIAGQFLTTDGAGNLSWSAVGGANVLVDTFSGTGSQTNFTLTQAPTSENFILVNIDGVLQLHNAYSVSGTTLTFTSAPASGSAIEVQIWNLSGIGGSVYAGNYSTSTFTANGVQTTTTVTNGMTVDTVIVTFDGVVQTPTLDYTVSGNILTFTAAPGNGVLVQIRELATGAGPEFDIYSYTGDNSTTEFAVTNGITANNVLVTLNGVLQTPGSDYTVNGSILTFSTAPGSGQAIMFRELAGNTGGGTGGGGGGASNARVTGYSLVFGG